MDMMITTEELKKKIDAGAKDYVLVDTLKKESYEARHVPTAISIPEDTDFVSNFEKATGASKDAEIIVYCTSETCQRHIRAAEALRAAGYTNVYRYADGLAGWQNAGFAFES